MIFKRNKKTSKKRPEKMKIKPLAYPPKILIAWGEAIAGNNKIRDWLIKNGYPELGMFSFALRNDDKAKMWLMQNGYPHLNALISGAEGDAVAIDWLNRFGYTLLKNMARAIDGDEKAEAWVAGNDKLFYVIMKKMEIVKDEIQMDNTDPHKINP